MAEALAQLELATGSTLPCLLLGEIGTGKSWFARRLHALSDRRNGPFRDLNCGSLKGDLLRGALFGHDRGAYTGATTAREGLFRQADGGTLFLDEIADLDPESQGMLNDVIQDGTVLPLGSQRRVPVDVRLVTATWQDLPALVRAGRFRQDLLDRIDHRPIRIPALRERAGDIPALVAAVAPGALVEDEALEVLVAHDWPGNVRELEKCLHKLTEDADGRIVRAGAVRAWIAGSARAASVPLAAQARGTPKTPAAFLLAVLAAAGDARRPISAIAREACARHGQDARVWTRVRELLRELARHWHHAWSTDPSALHPVRAGIERLAAEARSDQEGYAEVRLALAAVAEPAPEDTGTIRAPEAPPESDLVFTVPYRAKRDSFVGRRDLLDRVGAMLSEGVAVSLHGLGGIGKTQLAVELAWRLRPRFPDGVVWLDGHLSDQERLATFAVEGLGEDASASVPARAAAAKRWLRAHPRCLLVLDDVQADFVAPVHGTWLSTSREPLVAAAEAVEVLELDPEDAVRLLAEAATRTSADPSTVADLAGELGGVPLLLELAGVWLSRHPRATWEGYLADFRADPLHAPGMRSDARTRGTGHIADVVRTLAVDPALGTEIRGFDALLETLACWEAEYLWPDLVEALCGAGDPGALLDEVRLRGLVREGDGGKLTMHRVLREVIRAGMPRGRRSDRLDQMAQASAAWLEARLEERDIPAIARSWVGLDQLLTASRSEGASGWAALTLAMGATLVRFDHFDTAAKRYLEPVEAAPTTGSDAIDAAARATSQLLLAHTRLLCEGPGAARETLERVVLPSEHPLSADVARFVRALEDADAGAILDQAALDPRVADGAEVWAARHAAAVAEGGSPLETAACAFFWGLAHERLGEHARAIAPYLSARSQLIELGTAAAALFSAELRLGQVLTRLGDFDRALEHLESASRIVSSLRGMPPATLWQLRASTGHALSGAGRPEEALARLEPLLSGEEGDEHSRGLAAQTAATILMARGEVARGRGVCEMALRSVPETSHQAGHVRLKLSECALQERDMAEAARQAEAALRLCWFRKLRLARSGKSVRFVLVTRGRLVVQSEVPRADARPVHE
ncbi:MAG: sigma 54-interacting transcriptional regulator, partial [Myxococcota bacterium]